MKAGVAMTVAAVTASPLRAQAEETDDLATQALDGEPPGAESASRIFSAHMEAELAGDLDKTLATMSENPHIVNIPTMIGGQGVEGVRTFYANRLIGQFFPPDAKFETISRTVTTERLIDELIISFTHTMQMDHILPGVRPTGKFVEAAFVVIVGIENGKVSYEHIHWDQANVLVQLGLIDPSGLPVTGAGAVAKLRDPSIPDPFFGEG
jgi:carboxymethylenebutenolidase